MEKNGIGHFRVLETSLTELELSAFYCRSWPARVLNSWQLVPICKTQVSISFSKKNSSQEGNLLTFFRFAFNLNLTQLQELQGDYSFLKKNIFMINFFFSIFLGYQKLLRICFCKTQYLTTSLLWPPPTSLPAQWCKVGSSLRKWDLFVPSMDIVRIMKWGSWFVCKKKNLHVFYQGKTNLVESVDPSNVALASDLVYNLVYCLCLAYNAVLLLVDPAESVTMLLWDFTTKRLEGLIWGVGNLRLDMQFWIWMKSTQLQ